VVLNIRLPEEIVGWLDGLVLRGIYHSRAEAIRDFIRQYIEADDVIVGVRMPKRLLLALKAVSEKRHFLDTSEAVRSMVRQRWLEATGPELKKKVLFKEKEIKEIQRKRLLEKIRKLSEELKELGEENEG